MHWEDVPVTTAVPDTTHSLRVEPPFVVLTQPGGGEFRQDSGVSVWLLRDVSTGRPRVWGLGARGCCWLWVGAASPFRRVVHVSGLPWGLVRAPSAHGGSFKGQHPRRSWYTRPCLSGARLRCDTSHLPRSSQPGSHSAPPTFKGKYILPPGGEGKIPEAQVGLKIWPCHSRDVQLASRR